MNNRLLTRLGAVGILVGILLYFHAQQSFASAVGGGVSAREVFEYSQSASTEKTIGVVIGGIGAVLLLAGLVRGKPAS